jgi:hypothetical protein
VTRRWARHSNRGLKRLVRRVKFPATQRSTAMTPSLFHQRGKITDMNDFNGSTTARATLRLKVMPRSTPSAIKTPPLPQTQSKANLKLGARWSDNYKEHMQADMDTLASR